MIVPIIIKREYKNFILDGLIKKENTCKNHIKLFRKIDYIQNISIIRGSGRLKKIIIKSTYMNNDI